MQFSSYKDLFCCSVPLATVVYVLQMQEVCTLRAFLPLVLISYRESGTSQVSFTGGRREISFKRLDLILPTFGFDV